MSAREETFRSTVGRDAEVPRKRRESDIRGIYRDSILASAMLRFASPFVLPLLPGLYD
jgi:hypothetical protein